MTPLAAKRTSAVRLHRRALLRASAAAGLALVASRPLHARAARGATRAGRWVEANAVGGDFAQWTGGAPPEPIAFETPWPVFAAAPHWSGDEPAGATVEASFSADGAEWSAPRVVGEDPDQGRPGRDGRRFGPLLMTDGARYVRYRTFDASGAPATLRGLAWEYIDASGTGELDAAQEAAPEADPEAAPDATPTAGRPMDGAPPIVSRRAWGADEGLRFRNGEEIWPREYRAVEHLVIHHSDTANFEDPPTAIRSIYYYHAVTRGWGDIGYNYLVDFNGVIYEGRAGGEWVVGGHALGYNAGTAGICATGRFAGEEPTPEMLAGLARIAAWAGRSLDPLGETPFEDIARLPTICAHRDVNPTACPGNVLYGDLGWLREDVRAAMEERAAAPPPESAPRFAPGDAVATTVAGVALREGPGRDSALITTVAAGERLTIAGGPEWADGMEWYQAEGATLSGWIAAGFLTPAAPPTDIEQWVGGGGNPGGAKDPGAAGAAWPPRTTVAVTGGDLHLRAAPAGPVLDTLPEGAWLTITGTPQAADGAAWYPVDTGLGTEGWVSGEHLRPA